MAKPTPNDKIDKAMDALLKECNGAIAVGDESGLKVKVEILKAAMTWEKLKHGITDKADEGTNWGAGDGQ